MDFKKRREQHNERLRRDAICLDAEWIMENLWLIDDEMQVEFAELVRNFQKRSETRKLSYFDERTRK